MPALSVADVNREDFREAPIPADQILAGSPTTRSCDLHASGEGGLSMNLWDCTAGLFRWHYLNDELVHVLEGEVRVTAPDGSMRVLHAGDTAHFPGGTSFVWEVDDYVKKLAIHRAPSTLPDRISVKASRLLRRRRPVLGARLPTPPVQPDLVLACLTTFPV